MPLSSAVFAQDPEAELARLMRRRDVTRALSAVSSGHAHVLEWQQAIAAIPAPSGDEEARARFVRSRFAEAGLRDVRVDGEGNVIGVLPGRRAHPRVLMSAHLDTVFPPGTPTAVRRVGGRLVGPGIQDNARGVAALLGLAQALAAWETRLEGSVVFTATVGEEGLGDLRGMRALFEEGGPGDGADYVVNLDGSGLDRIVIGAVGSRRYRVTYTGPGGHSWNDFGLVNPANALGRAIDALARLPLPSTPKSSVNVGRVGGGTSVNSIPEEAWLEVDIRSVDVDELRRLDGEVMRVVQQALRDERSARDDQHGRLRMDVRLVGERAAVSQPVRSPIVRAARAATRALGVDPLLTESSTDANVPLARGVPAVSVGAGGLGGRAHTEEEWFDPRAGEHGVQRALLLVLLLAGIDGG